MQNLPRSPGRQTTQGMLHLCALASRRFRSEEDYRALQRALAERSLGQLGSRGVNFTGLSVLELGSGEGGYSSSLAGRSASLVASDLHASEYYRAGSLPFVQLDATRGLPFTDGAFDLIYCSSLIEHVARPAEMLAECHRVLKPGGRLYLSFPPFYSLFLIGGHQFKPFHLLGEKLSIWLTNAIHGSAYHSYETCYGDHGLFPLTIAEVNRLVQDAGFTVEQLFTRTSPINSARLPGLLADLLTWHVCYLARN